MAYKIKKSSRLIEEVELDNGTILKININIGKLANSINSIYSELLLVINSMQKEKEDLEILEKAGKVSLALINIVFGTKNTNILLDYFEEDYIALLEQTLPFIQDIVLPRIKQVEKEKREIAAQNYKYSKK